MEQINVLLCLLGRIWQSYEKEAHLPPRTMTILSMKVTSRRKYTISQNGIAYAAPNPGIMLIAAENLMQWLKYLTTRDIPEENFAYTAKVC